MPDSTPSWLQSFSKYMPGPQSKYRQTTADVWIGFLHGFILPLTFVYKQFEPSVELWETENVERWYNVAYVLGIIVILRILVN
ncbi:MAG: hypothetical protein ACE5D8_09980 [Fidelibacterota bacterium]